MVIKVVINEEGKSAVTVEVAKEATVAELLKAAESVRTTVDLEEPVIEFPEGTAINKHEQPISALGIVDGSIVFFKSHKAADAVTEEEVASTIVITNIPNENKMATEIAIYQHFASYGGIKRLILQADGESLQHAVLVFVNADAATASLERDGSTLLNGQISVIAAGSLPAPSAAKEEPDAAVKSVAKFLADGYSVGYKGFTHVQRFDEEHKISLQVKSGAEVAKMKAQELDAQFHVSEKIATVGKKAHELDEKYQVSQKASDVAHQAVSAADALAKRAMENKHVSAGVDKINSLFSSLMSVATQTVEETKKEIHEHEAAAAPAAPVAQEPKKDA
ncbi:hypothetical protein THRCLA_10373 [Thraustotheca clavata]|uniref:RRM domain-containing protein n=1 Tax=Thraustotheca clavata TaxID=74557 RepID=A0A1V9YRM6_9STRA|nr:hypothetical protein THRCLA_10373 [Thraustotheca clavata]